MLWQFDIQFNLLLLFFFSLPSSLSLSPLSFPHLRVPRVPLSVFLKLSHLGPRSKHHTGEYLKNQRAFGATRAFGALMWTIILTKPKFDSASTNLKAITPSASLVSRQSCLGKFRADKTRHLEAKSHLDLDVSEADFASNRDKARHLEAKSHLDLDVL